MTRITKTQRSAVVTVAASNTPATKLALADYVCAGTNDEVTIAAAVAALRTGGSTTLTGHNQEALADYASEGGTVLFLAGDYQIDTTLTLTGPHHLALEGEGGAVLVGNMTDTTNVVEIVGTAKDYGLNRIRVEGLTITGNYTDDSTRSGHGLYIYDCHYTTIKGNHFVANGGDGLHVDLSAEEKGAQNHLIALNQCVGNFRHGVYTGSIHDCVVANCQIEENGKSATLNGNGWRAENTYNCNAQGGNFEDNGNGNEIIYWTGISGGGVNNVDVEGDVYIDVASGFKFTWDSTLTNGDLAFNGPNAFVSVAGGGCDALTATLTDGSVTVSGGRFDSINITAPDAHISEIFTNGSIDFAGNTLTVSGGQYQIGTITTAIACSMIGGEVHNIESGATITYSGDCVFYPARCIVNNDLNFRPGADQARLKMDGNYWFQGSEIDIDGTTYSTCRLDLCGNARLTKFDINGIDNLRIGGAWVGSGTIAISDCDTSCVLVGNSFENVTVTIENTCACDGVIVGNHGTVTNNGTGTFTTASNQA